MGKSLRLTRHAEASLRNIAAWTLDNFGANQTEAYQRELIARCQAVADGTAHTQSCRGMIDAGLPEELRFTRIGGHLVIFTDTGEEIVIIDFLHGQNDLPRRLAGLSRREH